MHQKINQIKQNERSPLIIKNFLTKKQIKKIQDLYKILPVEINNRRQKIIKYLQSLIRGKKNKTKNKEWNPAKA